MCMCVFAYKSVYFLHIRRLGPALLRTEARVSIMFYFLQPFYIRMDLEEIGINAGNWVDLAQDRNYWRSLVNAAFNLRVQ